MLCTKAYSFHCPSTLAWLRSAQAVELHVVTQIGEHRLHRGEAPAVFGAALCAVDALLHALGVNVLAEMLTCALAHKEGHLTHLGFFGGA